MKNLIFFTVGTAGLKISVITLILLCSFTPDQVAPVKLTWYIILLLIIGLYEVVVRIIPAVARFSLIALIIDILKLISDYLKRKK